MSNISVVYSMTRLGKEPTKQTGKGFINEFGVLMLKVRKADGTYKWKGIDDFHKYLFPILNKPKWLLVNKEHIKSCEPARQRTEANTHKTKHSTPQD